MVTIGLSFVLAVLKSVSCVRSVLDARGVIRTQTSSFGLNWPARVSVIWMLPPSASPVPAGIVGWLSAATVTPLLNARTAFETLLEMPLPASTVALSPMRMSTRVAPGLELALTL